MFRRLLFVAPFAVVSAAACAPADDGSSGGGEEETPQAHDTASASADEAVLVANSAWLSVGEDGSVLTTFLDPDGRYRDGRNGTMADSGRWEQRPSGEVCFIPDAGSGDCWTAAAPQDGSTIVTSGDGKRVEIKRITYTAPVIISENTQESN